MNKKLLMLLIPVSFIGFVGGCVIGICCNSIGYIIMGLSGILTFIVGMKIGDIVYCKLIK